MSKRMNVIDLSNPPEELDRLSREDLKKWCNGRSAYYCSESEKKSNV